MKTLKKIANNAVTAMTATVFFMIFLGIWYEVFEIITNNPQITGVPYSPKPLVVTFYLVGTFSVLMASVGAPISWMVIFYTLAFRNELWHGNHQPISNLLWRALGWQAVLSGVSGLAMVIWKTYSSFIIIFIQNPTGAMTNLTITAVVRVIYEGIKMMLGL